MADDVDATDVQLIDPPNLSEAEHTTEDSGEIESQTSQEVTYHSAAKRKRRPPDRWMAVAGTLVALLVIAGLGACFGYRVHQDQRAEQQRNLFLQAGCQGALNLTTIDYTKVDADIQRVLDSSTGTFYDDFQKRSPALAEFVKKAKSKTQGTITESGIESISGDSARVLVAVSVRVSNVGAGEQEPRNWRMRIDVQKDGDDVKISNMGFVV
jgi:Mce-associated membrane protein